MKRSFKKETEKRGGFWAESGNGGKKHDYPNDDLIDEIVRRVSGAVGPLRVILFGSAARGEMGPASDVDLLIVVPDGTRRREASRKAFRALSGLGIAKDVIVVTEGDLKEFGGTRRHNQTGARGRTRGVSCPKLGPCQVLQRIGYREPRAIWPSRGSIA